MAKFRPFYINIAGRLTEIARPWVMGILNVTPDSFYAGSRTMADGGTEARARQLLAQGADVIDIGGYSSRPGASEVTPQEEFDRLQRGIAAVKRIAPHAIISIDTFRASVARRCVAQCGAHIINDISGGDLDPEMHATVAQLHVPYVLMHTRGTPATMQQHCQYPGGVAADVIAELAQKADHLRSLGACDIIIDPGFGFAKTVEQNYELMSQLDEFHHLDLPLLVGISRKSMIYRLLGITPADALNGTTVLNTAALLHGAHLLRVHDVAAAVEAVKIVAAMTHNYEYSPLTINN